MLTCGQLQRRCHALCLHCWKDVHRVAHTISTFVYPLTYDIGEMDNDHHDSSLNFTSLLTLSADECANTHVDGIDLEKQDAAENNEDDHDGDQVHAQLYLCGHISYL